MGRSKHKIIRNNQYEGRGWEYVCDTEADMQNPPVDMLYAVVVTPDTGKTQFRIRKSDGTFGELSQDIKIPGVIE